MLALKEGPKTNRIRRMNRWLRVCVCEEEAAVLYPSDKKTKHIDYDLQIHLTFMKRSYAVEKESK